MRRRASLIALCIGLVFNSAAQAEPLAAPVRTLWAHVLG